jgi:hypothetical protein
MKVATSVAFLFLVWVVGAGQTTDKSKIRPDLSGVWALDDSRSNINAGVKEKISDYVLTIAHHEPEIRMTKTYKEGGRERSEETIYYTDGRAESNSVKGKNSEPVTRWQGSRLVRRSSTTAKGAPQTFPPIEVVTTETWELSPDTKTLTRTVKSSGMVTFNARYVFTRSS